MRLAPNLGVELLPNMKWFTIVMVNWQARPVMELCLRSFIAHHPGRHKILLWDNSSADDSKDWLRQNNIPFLQSESNIGHEAALNVLWSAVTTKYVLLLDTDILFHSNVAHYFDRLDEVTIAAGDLIDGDKLDSPIKPRLGAWAIFFDIQALKDKGVKTFRTKEDWSYDCCSELYENIITNGFKVSVIPRLPGDMDRDEIGMKYGDFSHLTRMSWDYAKHGDRIGEIEMRKQYVVRKLEEFKDVSLEGVFY